MYRCLPGQIQPRYPEHCLHLLGTVALPAWLELPLWKHLSKDLIEVGCQERVSLTGHCSRKFVSHCGIVGELTFHGHLDLHPNQNVLALFLLLGWLLSATLLKLPVPLEPMGSSVSPLIAFLSSI